MFNNAECRRRKLTPTDFVGPDGGEDRLQREEREERMKAVCRTCPVIVECLEWAMKHREKGVWGGTNEEDRAVLRRRAARRGTDGLTDAQRVRWDRERRAYELYCDGVPVVEIAESLGISADTAYTYIKRQKRVHGAEADPPAEAGTQAVLHTDRYTDSVWKAASVLVVGELL